jgi:hypothetical protein
VDIVAAGFHRYPESRRHPRVPHTGFSSTVDEIAQFRNTVGPRLIFHGECGFHSLDYTEKQILEYTDWSVKFYRSQGCSTYCAYQLNDGPSESPEHVDHYGYRQNSEDPFDWKPVMAALVAA